MKKILVILSLINIIPIYCTNSPVVILHGIASDKTNMVDMELWLRESFNLSVFNIDIGDGYDTSVNVPMKLQTKILCDVIQSIPELSDGFNFIGMSQGGLLARAYVETCNDFPVKNLITLVSPHGGQYDSDSLFNIIDIYGNLLQSTTSFAGYWRNPLKYSDYLLKCQFLPDLNTEKISDKTNDYYTNMISLDNFVMVWSSTDDVIKPPQSAKFSSYDANLNIIDLFDSKIYQEDRLGLKTLNDSNRLWMFETTCSHGDTKLPICFPQLYPIMKQFLL